VEMSVMLVRDGNGQTAVELLRRRGSAEAPRRLPPQTQVKNRAAAIKWLLEWALKQKPAPEAKGE
jgi:hypothetical protein